MVVYFNRKDLVSFGTYLMSERRRAKFDKSYGEDRLNDVYHADIENWFEEQNNK